MKIQILMSAYQGSPYIRTQLESIAAQKQVDFSLLVRDDGSSDDTPKLLEEYRMRFPWLSYYIGSNIGVQKSFLELIRRADPEADYIALADQDDQWLPDKLCRAVQCIRSIMLSADTPQLYCSAKLLVDQELRPLSTTVSQPVRKAGFGNALVQNICTGCTAVFNRAMLRLLQSHMPEAPQDMIMHDWWLYLTASCFGQVFYDHNAYIRYRQHGANAWGAMLSRRSLLAYRLHELRKPRGDIYRQTALFLKIYADLLGTDGCRQNRILAERLLAAQNSFAGRLKLAADPRYYRQKRSDDLVFRGIVLTGKL